MRRIVVLLMLSFTMASCVPSSGLVAVEYVPDDYARYPRTYYDGRVVYYIDGRWYARDGRRWHYYRREPAELYRYRTHVHRAPPAYPRRRTVIREPRREAPPARDRRDRRDRDREPRRAPPAVHRAPPAR